MYCFKELGFENEGFESQGFLDTAFEVCGLCWGGDRKYISICVYTNVVVSRDFFATKAQRHRDFFRHRLTQINTDFLPLRHPRSSLRDYGGQAPARRKI